MDFSQLLFDETKATSIVECRNIYMKFIASNFESESDARQTNITEIRAFISLLYLGAIHKSSHVNVPDIWHTTGTGLDNLDQTMSDNSFFFLTRCIRFDDKTDRFSGRQLNKLALIRFFLKILLLLNVKIQFI